MAEQSETLNTISATELIYDEPAASSAFGWGFVATLIIVVGAVLRCLALNAAASPAEVTLLARVVDGITVGQAPFTDMLFWLATQFPGDDLLNMRIMTATVSTLTLPIFVLAARRATDQATATFALALLALAPLAIETAQRVQPQPLAQLALVLCWLAFEQLRQVDTLVRWLLLAVVSLVATRVAAPLALLIAPMLLTLLLITEYKRRRVLLGVAATLALCALSFALAGSGTEAANPLRAPALLARAIGVFGGIGVLPPLLEQVVRATLGVCLLAALSDWRQWEGLLPYIAQIAVGIVLLLVGTPRGDVSLALLLPIGLLLIASGLFSLGRVRFVWPLAATLGAVLFVALVMGLVDLFV